MGKFLNNLNPVFSMTFSIRSAWMNKRSKRAGWQMPDALFKFAAFASRSGGRRVGCPRTRNHRRSLLPNPAEHEVIDDQLPAASHERR
jgi:hypothetical protein